MRSACVNPRSSARFCTCAGVGASSREYRPPLRAWPDWAAQLPQMPRSCQWPCQWEMRETGEPRQQRRQSSDVGTGRGSECPVLVSCASCAPFAREAPDFPETESGVQMQCGSVIRPAHIEDVAGASEGPTQPGLGQRRCDTPAPPRRLHQNVPPQETRNKSTSRGWCVSRL
jgi:hypothetical protein